MMAVECPCKRCGTEVGPGKPDGGADELLCLRCWKEDAVRSVKNLGQAACWSQADRLG